MMKGNFPLARKSDRQFAAGKLSDLAAQLDAKYEQRPDGREIRATMTKRGVSVMLSLTPQRWCGLLHWYSRDRLPRSFGMLPSTDVNPYHGCKATTSTCNVEHMLEIIAAGFVEAQL